MNKLVATLVAGLFAASLGVPLPRLRHPTATPAPAPAAKAPAGRAGPRQPGRRDRLHPAAKADARTTKVKAVQPGAARQ